MWAEPVTLPITNSACTSIAATTAIPAQSLARTNERVPPGPEGSRGHQPSPKYTPQHPQQHPPRRPPQHRTYHTAPDPSILPPMFSQNDHPQHQSAQHQPVQLHVTVVQPYFQNCCTFNGSPIPPPNSLSTSLLLVADKKVFFSSFAQNDHFQYQSAQHQPVRLQVAGVQPYVQNCYTFNFHSSCTVNLTFADGEGLTRVTSCPQSGNRAPAPAPVNPIPPVAPVHPAGRTSHRAPTLQYAPEQRPPQALGTLASVPSLPRSSPLTEQPCKRSRPSARTMPTSNSSECEGGEDGLHNVRTRSHGSTSAHVNEANLNDWEAVVDMYLHGTGAPDGVPLRDHCKGDGRRVNDYRLLEKRRTVGKTFEFLGAPRFKAAIGYRWDGNLRRKQKLYIVINRCRVVNAMRKAGEPVPDDFATLAEMIDTRIRDKERAKEEREAKRTAEPRCQGSMPDGSTRITVMPRTARQGERSVALVRRTDSVPRSGR